MHNQKVSTNALAMVPKGCQCKGARGEGAIAPLMPLKKATVINAFSAEPCFTGQSWNDQGFLHSLLLTV